VALQAAQRARAVFASRVGGLPEVVEDGGTGMLFEPENPTALARLLDGPAMDFPLLARMGMNAENRAGRLFTPDVMARKYWDVFSHALAA
jgi:glycosyltransferase involved in cell wall biosynthesis